ncbi:MAG: hypothetical protein U5K71_12090 [Gracilimonas sp.]|nr:hypothetical protein [Gracilimonas sp.]
MSREVNHQEAEDADEVIVVQIGGLVQSSSMSGKAEAKDDDGNAVLKAQSHKKG